MPTFSWTLTSPPVPSSSGGSASSTTLGGAVTLADLVDYGLDCTTWADPDQTEPDLDPTFGTITGIMSVAQACARRLCMPHGTLGDDPDAGYDIRKLVNSKWDKSRAFSTKLGIERECMKDERVRSAAAKLTYYPRSRRLDVDIQLDTVFGVFDLVLAVDAVSVRILRAA